MKHNYGKKTLALLLTIVMIVSMIPMMALPASATGKTADEAIAWVKSQLGKSIDADGAYGAQCVDLILAYYTFLGVSRVSGNGCDYSWNALPSGWTRTAGGKPQKGDILVYTNGEYGHVAIYESDYSHYHQNYNSKQYVVNVTSHSYNWSGSSYWGCIHPNFASSVPTPATYTVSYNANGGSGAPASQTKTQGTALTLSSTKPTRTGYDFLGWSTSSTATSATYSAGGSYTTDAAVTLYAVWKIKTYTITWMIDGKSETTTVNYGVMPTHTTPGKASDAEYTYTFTGWEPALVNATANATYTAQFSKTARLPGESDWVLESQVPEGATITDTKWVYTKTETKESTATSMSGWNQTGSRWEQTGSGTHYYASFPAGYNTGDSYYQNFAKSALSNSETTTAKRTVSNGTFNSYIYWHWTYPLASYNSTTYDRKISDTYNDYLSGGGYATLWYAFESTTDYPYNAGGGAYKAEISGYAASSFWWFRFNTYKQTYTDYQKVFTYQKVTTGLESASEVKAGNGISDVKKYVKFVSSHTVTWDVEGVQTTETYSYGETPAYKGSTPTKASDAQYTYTFTGWSPEITAVTGDKTYTAQFSSTVRNYTVTWDVNGTTTAETYAYGETPSYKGGTPTKAADTQYTYTFSGWTPEITAVTGDVTYTAQFTAEPIVTEPDLTVSVKDVTIFKGQKTVTLEILCENEGKLPVVGYEFALSYDTDRFTFDSVDHFPTLSGAKYGAESTSGKSGYPLVLSCTLDPAKAGRFEGGVIARVTFTVADGIEPGDYGFGICADGTGTTLYDMNNGIATPYEVAFVGGMVNVQDYIPGDCNGDGTLSIMDVTVLLSALSDIIEPLPFGAFDVYTDGVVSITDVTALLTLLSKQ